jgi:hypothetical protein
MSTRSEKVRIFTEESMGKTLPSAPRVMSRQEVEFIVRMNCEELMELISTVIPSTEDPKDVLTGIVKQSRLPALVDYSSKPPLEIMADQVDAFADIDYYNCNAAAKVGFNVDKIFDIVHQANMNKKFDDGTFHKDSTGKVIKPPGWTEPSVVREVEKWEQNGTWS